MTTPSNSEPSVIQTRLLADALLPLQYATTGVQPQIPAMQPQFTSIQPQFTSYNPYLQQMQQEAMQVRSHILTLSRSSTITSAHPSNR